MSLPFAVGHWPRDGCRPACGSAAASVAPVKGAALQIADPCLEFEHVLGFSEIHFEGALAPLPEPVVQAIEQPAPWCGGWGEAVASVLEPVGLPLLERQNLRHKGEKASAAALLQVYLIGSHCRLL